MPDPTGRGTGTHVGALHHAAADSRDFEQLDAACTAWRKTRDKQYLEFMAENAGRILRENKALTKDARKRVQEYAEYASSRI